MKIDTSGIPLTTPQKTRPQPAAAPLRSPSADASVTTHLQQTSNLISAEAPFDSQRVAEIRQAIAEGRFEINASKIADRLITDVRESLAKEQHTGN
ncbi:MAG: flagellar biosynthesis anti-sigma factor FlgM [Rugosibacter sp.]